MNWSEKEQAALKSLQKEEKMCAEKYSRAADCTENPALAQMFRKISGEENGHYNTVTRMLEGSVPAPAAGKKPMTQAPAGQVSSQQDQFLLEDLLATEKFTSGAYNSAVFDFEDEQARQVLSEIEQEEEHHGKQLSDWMPSSGLR